MCLTSPDNINMFIFNIIICISVGSTSGLKRHEPFIRYVRSLCAVTSRPDGSCSSGLGGAAALMDLQTVIRSRAAASQETPRINMDVTWRQGDPAAVCGPEPDRNTTYIFIQDRNRLLLPSIGAFNIKAWKTEMQNWCPTYKKQQQSSRNLLWREINHERVLKTWSRLCSESTSYY